jgi:glutathione peroxidase
MSLWDFTPNSLAGKPQPLAAYKGKVALVVNVASECGFTPQYAGLEQLFEEYAPKGLVVLGFPSNDFGKQEPGSGDEIASFCEKNYGVKFPMFEKLSTKDSPIYAFLAAKHGAPKWNFHKYLVGKDGEVRGAFPSPIAPDANELRAAIDEALKS